MERQLKYELREKWSWLIYNSTHDIMFGGLVTVLMINTGPVG